MGMLDGRKKRGILLTTGKATETIVAPSFFGRRQYNSSETMQYMWFCPTDITHTWQLNKYIVMVPSKNEGRWCVSIIGTSLSQDEVDMLNKGGYMLECMEEHETRIACPFDGQQTGPNMEEFATPSQKGKTRRRHSIFVATKERIARAIEMRACIVKEDVKVKN
ncbi:hypothetical protein O6H91_Y236200 [Diphasiastrum complanatum]|nr:hypothetical protein O6H91_Y236200 [Diphasiastrum complanatum]